MPDIKTAKAKNLTSITTPRRVTVKDVAERAGVSFAGVSVVLNGAKSNTHVSDAARERILQAAEELGYRRNGAVQAMQSGHFKCVALLLSTKEWCSTLPQPTWDGIHDELAMHDMHLTMTRLPDEKLIDEGVLPKVLREWMVDGLLIDYTHRIPTRLMELIRNYKLPAVWLNSQQTADCVFPNDWQAGYDLTRHLLSLGHRHLCYIDFTHPENEVDAHYSVAARLLGCIQAAEDASVQMEVFWGAETPLHEKELRIQQMLTESNPVTAVVSYSSDALGLVAYVAAKMGLDIPRDLSLAAFDSDQAICVGRRVTTAVVPENEMGRRAVQMLMHKIAEPQTLLPPDAVAFNFQAGETVAPRKN